jgi:hypothetical protein
MGLVTGEAVSRYPMVELDPIRRLHVLAAALPGAAVAERVLDSPFDAVWQAATDFEDGIPKIEILIGSTRILSSEGDRLEVALKLRPFGPTRRMQVLLRPGWCWMQAPFGVAAMAARAEGNKTRFAHLEAVSLPGGRMAAPLLRLKMALARELKRIERLARERADDD